jgi:hypothetical protein
MKKHLQLLALSISITFAAAPASGSAPTPTGAGRENTPTPSTQIPILKDAPTASGAAALHKSRAFRVTDEKGLLLSCIAPKIDTDANTDVFEDCNLAPDRTLDELMHTFVGAIHYEQNQHAQERAEWYKDLEEKSDKKTANK